jgi:hypothetical protein
MNLNKLKYKLKYSICTIIIVVSTLFLGQTKVLAGTNDVTGFVTRLYEQCLYRAPDTDGLNYWVNMLSGGTVSGSNAAERFIYSSEFMGKNLSDDQFINVMYKTFFNRDADVPGKAYWTDMLQKGATRRFVFSRFASSTEFEGICNLYGITKGSVELYNNVDRYPAITGFTQRFYSKFQGRTPDLGGLTYWVDRLVAKESSAADLAIGFASSSEFIGKNLSNEEYVATLYKAFMDREPDLSGQTYWVNKLTLGHSRKFLLSRFLDSQEFKSLCSSYGISNGVIGTTAEDLPPLYKLSNTHTYQLIYNFVLESEGISNVSVNYNLGNISQSPYQKDISYEIIGEGATIQKNADGTTNLAVNTSVSKDKPKTFKVIRTLESYELNYNYDLSTTSNNYYLFNEYGKYTSPSIGIQSDNSLIINKANELFSGLTNPYDKAKKAYEFVVSYMKYDYGVFSSGDALYALRGGIGVCSDYSKLMVALLRASGVPARMVSGYRIDDAYDFASTNIINTEPLAHGWVEFYLPDYGWIIAEPTVGGIVYNGKLTTYDYFAKQLDDLHIIHTNMGDGSLGSGYNFGNKAYIEFDTQLKKIN